VVLLPALALAVAFSSAPSGVREPAAQQGADSIVGIVTDSRTGTGIAGANVSSEDRIASVTTDARGHFRILGLAAGPHTLTARRLGYAPVSRPVTLRAGARATVDFSLTPVATNMSEVVTTASGDQQRVEVGSSIGTIKADSVVGTTLIRDLSDLLTSRTPGVVVSNTSGEVGAPSRIRIRGINSAQLNNDPIVVVDGQRVLSQLTSAKSQIGLDSVTTLAPALNGVRQLAPSRLDDIDPNTIESIDILRGPSAASLYGTEAANGVIVINTKRAAPGPFRFNVTADQGVQNLPGRLPLVWFGWGRLPNGAVTSTCALANANPAISTPTVSDATCVQDSVRYFQPQYDKYLSTLGTGSARNVSMSASGGTTALREFFSLRVSDLVGMTKMSDFESNQVAKFWDTPAPSWMVRPNTERDLFLRSNTNAQLRSDLDVAISASFVYRDNLNGGTPLTSGSSGQQFLNITGPSDTLAYLPSEAQRSKSENLTSRGFGSISARYTPKSWLLVRGNIGIDYTTRTDDALTRAVDCTMVLNPAGCTSGDANTRSQTVATSVDLGAQATFHPREWLRSVTSVGEQYDGTRFAVHGVASGTSVISAVSSQGGLTSTSGGNGGLFQSVTNDYAQSATAGVYVEEMAALRERLFLTAGLRSDAASAFGSKAANPIYPKLGASWLVSDEPFFTNRSIVSSFRLRTAYGHSGNQASPLDVLRSYQPGEAVINGVLTPGIVLASIGNPDLKPERTTEWEGGFDVAFFKADRVRVEATMYRKLSEDAIMTVALPPSYGTATANGAANLTQSRNVGSVENRGLELLLTARVLDFSWLGWDFTVNAATLQNKLVSKSDLVPRGTGPTQLVAGYPLFGLWQRPVLSYKDVNGDGILSFNEIAFGDTAVFVGTPYSKANVTYTNDFIFLRGALRLRISIDQVLGVSNTFNSLQIDARARFDRSSSLADQAAMMQAGIGGGFMTPSNTLRINEVSLTYDLPAATAQRLFRARSLSVTAAGRNIRWWTNYRGLDPNIDTSGTLGDAISDNGLGVPQPRQFTLRLNVGY